MKKTAIAVGLMLALSGVAVTAQTTAPAGVKATPLAVKTTPAAGQANSDFCKVNLTKTTQAKPGTKFKRAKAKRPGKAGLKRISRKPHLDVCDSPDMQPIAQQGGTGGNGAGTGTGGKPATGSGNQMASGDKLPEGDLTQILEPTAAGPVAGGAPAAFAAPAAAPATFTSAPSFGGGGGGVGVATRN